MESNISRDHIALEAMKVIMKQNIIVEETLLSRVKCWLFGCGRKFTVNNVNPARCAEVAYQYADAMIAERDNVKGES